jgi:UDP-glucose 4-epimerase
MILFTGQADTSTNYRVIAIFGVGLIGSAVVSAIHSYLMLDSVSLPLNWLDPGQQKRHLKAIEEIIINHLALTSRSRLDVVWCAGQAGFSASEHQTSIELTNFRRVLAMAIRIADRFPKRDMRFHLISSAGGLFDGQRDVTVTSNPTPKRPYGKLKRKQEQLLEKIPGIYNRYIYRPSSVYGLFRPGQRRGLISTMVTNGIRNQVTYITGRMTTLRDFVAVNDVANFVLSRLRQKNKPEIEAYMLVSGKPSTILEIKKNVENVINKRLYINYLLDPSNEEDNSFSSSVMPQDWRPSSLRQNIQIIYADALSSGILFSRPT